MTPMLRFVPPRGRFTEERSGELTHHAMQYLSDVFAALAGSNAGNLPVVESIANSALSLAQSLSTSFDEMVDDRVNALLVAGSNITKVYNDSLNTLTISASGAGGGGNIDDVLAVNVLL